MILTQQLNTTALRVGAKAAYRFLGKETSFNDFKVAVARLSYLYQHEIGPKGRVAFLTRNAPAVMTTFFALSNIRGITIPMDPDRSPDELIDWLKESKATHIAVTSDLLPKARELMQHSRLGLPIIEIEKKTGGEYDQTFTAAPDNQPADTDSILLLRTTGHTGKPKFVPFNHKQVLAAAISIRSSYRMGPNDRFYSNMSWAYPFAFVHHMLMPMMNGGTVVIDHGLDGSEFLDFLLESKVNRMIGTPPFLFHWLNVCKVEKKLPVGIKSVTVGMGTLSPELRKAFGMLKIGVLQTYGQTENVWTVAMEDLEDKAEAGRGFIGKGLAGNKYKIIDAHGDEIEGKGEREGMLAVTGPACMTSYLDRPAETKVAVRGTWLYTGDYVRAEGHDDSLRLTFLSRKEESVFGNGGKIVAADPIDKVARAIAGVADAAGFAVLQSNASAKFGIAVVKNPGSPLTETQIISQCKAHLPSNLEPTIVTFVDVIPRDVAGTINRAKLALPFIDRTSERS